MAVKKILASKNVQDAIEKEMKSPNYVGMDITREEIEFQATTNLNRICSSVRPMTINVSALFVQRLWRAMYDQVVVNKKELMQYKKLIDNGEAVVLVPQHRSDIDFILLSSIFHHFGMHPPYVAGNDDYSNLTLITSFLRSCGGFFISPE